MQNVQKMETGKGSRADVLHYVRRKRKISPEDRNFPRTREDGGNHVCWACEKTGDLLGCKACPRIYHLSCLQPPLQDFPSGDFLCPFCDDDEVSDLYSSPPSPKRVHTRRAQKNGAKDKGRTSFSCSERQIEEADDESSSTSGLQNLRTGKARFLPQTERKRQYSGLESSRKSAGPSERLRPGPYNVGRAGKDGLLILRDALKYVMVNDRRIKVSDRDESSDENYPEPRGKAIVPEERHGVSLVQASESYLQNYLPMPQRSVAAGDWSAMLTDPNLKFPRDETSNGFGETCWKQQIELFGRGNSSGNRYNTRFVLNPACSFAPMPGSAAVSSTTTRTSGSFQIPSIILRPRRNGCARESVYRFLKAVLEKSDSA